MSLYDNESNIYPDLSATAAQKLQTYCLKKLTEIETFFLDEIKIRERIAKKMKRFNTVTGIVDTDLITSTVITGGISIAAFASGVTVITQKSFKPFTVKQEKHNSMKLLSQSKLDSITDTISWAMQDGDISRAEFHKVLQKVEKYRKLKAYIRNQAKTNIKQITKEQREEILEQERKEDKEDFLRQIANISGTQGVSAI